MSSLSTNYPNTSSQPQLPPSGALATVASIPSGEVVHEDAHRLRHAISTFAIVAILAGVAFWGHQTHWTFVGDVDPSKPDAKAGWCAEHSVPEELCIECKAGLKPAMKDFGWCEEHGVAQCPLHHPEVAQTKEPASVEPADLDRAQKALALLPRAANNSRCLLHQRRIQFASPEAIEKAGIDIALVQRIDRKPIVEAVTANGEIIYDQTKLAHLSGRAAGTVWRVFKQTGDRVKQGDLLALVDAAEVGRAKSQFLETLADVRVRIALVDKLRPLKEQGGISGRKLTEAEAELQSAEIKLRTAQQALLNLGLSVDANDYDNVDLREIAKRVQHLGISEDLGGGEGKELTSSNLLPIRAPLDGIVVERHAVPGEVVDTDARLLSVADTSRMWLMLHVRQEEISSVHMNQPVLFRATGDARRPEVEGKVAWIDTSVDEATRTIQVRVELANNDGQLRANTFGAGRIVLREEPGAIIVPSEAVHWDGCCHVVFVRDKDYFNKDAPKFFHVRKVRLGVEQDGMREIIVGLLPGEVVASKGSNVLESQLLKAKLGEGCGCGHGHSH
jgi:cobalt-zinc-cadmium efflux system membrane fusion protein